MSNRRRPRNQRFRGIHELAFVDSIPEALADLSVYKCPDCDSEARPTMVGKYAASVEIAHDAGCPWMAGATR